MRSSRRAISVCIELNATANWFSSSPERILTGVP